MQVPRKRNPLAVVDLSYDPVRLRITRNRQQPNRCKQNKN
jgi:hypothetical protein